MSQATVVSLPVVVFIHQGHYFALEAAYVRSQGRVCTLEQAQRESVVTVAGILDPSAVQSASVIHYLELAGATQSSWLGLEQAAELVELPVADIQALPAVLQVRRCVPALRALAWYQGHVLNLLDARVVLQNLRPHQYISTHFKRV